MKLRREREAIVRSRRLLNCGGRPLKLIVRRAMSKARAIVLALASGVVGLVAGIAATAWFMSSFLNYATGTSAVASIVVDGDALSTLSSGDTAGATRLLQSRLDGELITIAVETKQGFTLTPQAKSAIARLKQLRDSSGYVPSDPGVRQLVQETLALGVADGTPNQRLERP
jgi:hypothetical protein